MTADTWAGPVTDVVRPRWIVKVGVPVAVADEESVNEVAFTMDATVAPSGIPVPETVAPTKMPVVLGTITVFDVFTVVDEVVLENSSVAVTRR